MENRFAKRKNASELVLTVMIWAILGLLGTRLYLELTGYPKITKGDWHIAHAFIGGLIMTGGMMIDLVLAGRKIKRLAAGVFGVGLGLFIDEVGKYLSKDNDYFFEPAIIVIYVFFVILFLIYKYLEKREKKNKTDGWIEMDWGWETKLWRRIRKMAYQKIFRRKIVIYSLLLIAIGYVIGGIGDAIYLWGTFKNDQDINIFTLKSLTDLTVGVMFGIGIYMVWKKKQRRGINFFRYGILVYIFLSSVFKFYFEQFSGVIGVALSIAIYYGLERMGKELAK